MRDLDLRALFASIPESLRFWYSSCADINAAVLWNRLPTATRTPDAEQFRVYYRVCKHQLPSAHGYC